jgi:DNA-binding NtrC family response regulator
MTESVLIVDDDPDVRRNLAAYLEDEGMTATAVDSSEAAAELLNSGAAFDVCIVDMRLPGAQGEAAIPLLKSLHPQLAFLLHTGTAGYRLPPALRTLGIRDADVFIKPIEDMGWIAEAVRGLVRQTRTAQNGH